MKIIFATHNADKVKEMKAILSGLDIEILSVDEAGVTEDILEDGKTFEENAFKKAKFVSEKIGEWVVVDDSGLCVDVLGGEPGIYSARYAGEKASSLEHINFVLGKMKNVPWEKRTATFYTVGVVVSPGGEHWTFVGKVVGRLTLAPRGTMRPKLPYDVIFIPDGDNRTFAEMSDREKNSLSHRGLAFRKLKEFLKEKLRKP